MNTPITDKLYWELQGKYGTGTFEDVLPVARRLEQDRAAVMEALERLDQWPSEPIEDFRHDGSVYGEISVGDMRAIRAALAAARANFPPEDEP